MMTDRAVGAGACLRTIVGPAIIRGSGAGAMAGAGAAGAGALLTTGVAGGLWEDSVSNMGWVDPLEFTIINLVVFLGCTSCLQDWLRDSSSSNWCRHNS